MPVFPGLFLAYHLFNYKNNTCLRKVIGDALAGAAAQAVKMNKQETDMCHSLSPSPPH
jgi:hypothetical protein